MRKRRLTFLSALILSLLLHFVLVAGGEITLPDFYTSSDEVLERKKPGKVQQVQLHSLPPAEKKVVTGMRYVRVAAVKPPTKAKAKKKKPAADVSSTSVAAQDAAPSQAAEVVAEKIAAPIVVEPEAVTPAPKSEPAPAFPIQVTATLQARYNSIPFTIRQNWVMEGFRYAIDQRASKFGFSFQITSEGRVNPEGGLSPEHYRLAVNDKVRAACDYRSGEIHYGKNGNSKSAPLPVTPQDMASLPFHVATTFNGQPQNLFVCTGNSVYQVRLSADAEEKIKLPAGTLRTLHLTGERFDDSLGQVVRGYEVWLALDYLNYPVKFIGHTSNGDRLEFSLKSMEMEGQRVLGDKSDDDDEPGHTDEIVPEWIRARSRQESLNKP
jgi:hypothetical protein